MTLFSTPGRRSWHGLLLGLLLLWGFPAASAADAPVLELCASCPPNELGGYWQVLLDSSGELTFEEVSSPELAARFEIEADDALSLGYTDASVWLRFRVKSTEPVPDDWLLEVDYPLLDHIEVYRSEPTGESVEAAGGGTWTQVVSGDIRSYHERPLPHRTFLFPAEISAGAVTQYYVHIRSKSSMQVHLAFYPTAGLFQRESRDSILFGLVYGVMLLMALYNGFLFIAVRDLSYLAYVLTVLSGTVFIMTVNGHAAQYLWPGSPLWGNMVAPLSAALWALGTLVFTQLFLDTRRYTRVGWKVINGAIVVALGAILISLLADYSVAVQVSTAMGLLVGFLILAVSALCLWRGNRSARFFTVAWLIYGAGTTTMIFNRMGLLPNTFWAYHAATMGLFAEIIILSLALSDKYRLLREELATYSKGLEAKVAERTVELEQANEMLREMAQQDSLTKLANRRLFDTTLTNEWERHFRDGGNLALLLVDVDQFKGLNDHFGHQYGDRSLQAVATAMSEALQRPADLAARYGGDEFAIVLPDTDLPGALAVADRIVAELKALAIPQAPGWEHRWVTVSIGVVSRVPANKLDPGMLVKEADKALYQAKAQGRNRVVASPLESLLRVIGRQSGVAG